MSTTSPVRLSTRLPARPPAAASRSELFVPQATAAIEAAGGRVLCNTAVAALTSSDGAATGVVLADGTRLRARFCVAAVPPHDLARLLPEGAARYPVFAALGDYEPSPYVSTYLWFARKLGRERFWARVWSPDTLSYDSYDLSNIRFGWAERPSVIASNIIYSHRAAAMTDDEIVAATVRELAEFLPAAARTEVVHARVHRIPLAKPCPLPGIEQKRPDARTPIRRLYLAGDWARTGLPMSMESAVRAGYLAAEQVLADAGRPRRLALAVPPLEGLVGWVGRLYGSASHHNRVQRLPSRSNVFGVGRKEHEREVERIRRLIEAAAG